MGSKAAGLARILAASASGALFALAQTFHPLWPALWLAPIPLLISAFSVGSAGTWGLVLVAGLIGAAPLASYYAQVATPVGAGLIISLQVLDLGALVQLARTAVRRGPAWAAPLAYPLAAAGLDTLLAAVSPHGSAGSWAYSQMDFLPGLQVAALGGAPAVVFLPALFASTAAVALVHRNRVAACALPLALLGAGLGFGFARLSLAKPEPTVSVALGALDELPMDPKSAGGPSDPTLNAYVDLIGRQSASRPALILSPEHLENLDASQAAVAEARLSGAARSAGAVLVMVEGLKAEPHWRNAALVFGPDGGRRTIYVKRHLISGLEGRFAPGKGTLVVEVAGRRLGVAICKDMDFASPASEYARQGVAALIVPAWDFGRDGWLHGRMAVLPGVEHGFGVIRSARDGLMSVSDRFGRVIAESPSQPAGANHLSTATPGLLASAPLGPGALTPYDRGGWLFGWACLVLAVLTRFAPAPRREAEESRDDLSTGSASSRR